MVSIGPTVEGIWGCDAKVRGAAEGRREDNDSESTQLAVPATARHTGAGFEGIGIVTRRVLRMKGGETRGYGSVFWPTSCLSVLYVEAGLAKEAKASAGEVSYLARTRVAHDSILKGNRLHMDNIKPRKPGDKAMSRPRHGIRGQRGLATGGC
jgi:hypothetical protein